jgi:5-methylcytosine-specific restriction endonuclease McrA
MDSSQYPINRAEAKAMGAKYYFTGQPCKHGHVALRKTKGSCVECIKIETLNYAVKRAEYFKNYNKSDASKESKRRYYEDNKELIIAKAFARPIEHQRIYKKKYKDKNPEITYANTSSYRRRHREATPPWLSKEHKLQVREMYITAQRLTKMTGERYAVDHIIPLRSTFVCGLHVPWNLRVITQEENLRKSNKLD